jgi:hypothetical protein
MDAHIELIGDRMLYIREQGAITAGQFEATTRRRLAFVKEHINGFYVVIYDLRQAQLAFMDLRLSKWSVEVDPNMLHVVGVSPQPLARVSANVLSNVMHLNLTLVETLDDAKAKAEALIAAETAKRGLSSGR